MKKYQIETMCVHDGLLDDPRGATSMPIYQSTAFSHATAEEMEEVFLNKKAGFFYSRVSNPSVCNLERRVSSLEGGVGGVACASGMAAITITVMSIAKSGDEIISSDSIFGGTRDLFAKTLLRYGIKVRFVEAADVQEYKKAVTEKSRLIFVETIGNPKLNVPDIKAISKVAGEAGIPLIVDNTVTTPFIFRSKEFGANLVVHSSTKFMNGSGNAVGGVMVDLGTFKWDARKFHDFAPYVKKYGENAFLAKVRKEVFRDFGPCMAPMNAYLTALGIETLGLRMERHSSNALRLAESLARHPKVKDLNYPGLPSNSFSRVVKSQFMGRGGALLTFRLGSKKDCFKFINGLALAKNAVNLGDAKTLVVHPASTIYADHQENDKAGMGAPDNLVRVSVGIEGIEDIINDFENALERV